MVFVVAAVSTAVLLQAGCSLEGSEEGPPPEEPLFAPGAYGGEPLPGTESLSNVRISPDGERVALVRERTPGQPSDPKRQLWITERDGSNPKLIGVNITSMDWSPGGKRLAVTVFYGGGVSLYVYTIDLETMEATQWTGREDQRFDRPVVSNPNWFEDGRRLLVSVVAKGYEQDFERGIYTIDTETEEIEGPFVEVMGGAFLGGGNAYAIGTKYLAQGEPLGGGNAARYSFATGEWDWVTRFSNDSLDYVQGVVPSPAEDLAVQSRKVENAWQLHLMDSDGEDVRRVTDFGGDNPRWSYDGEAIVFRRDVHRGRGARYVPFRLDLATLDAAPLFAAQPDSLPDFPPLQTQTLNLRRQDGRHRWCHHEQRKGHGRYGPRCSLALVQRPVSYCERKRGRGGHGY